MRVALLGCVVLVSIARFAHGAPCADGAFVPAPASKGLLDASLHPIPPQVVADYLGHVDVVHTFREFEGLNDELQATAGPLEVAAGYPIDMPADDLFDGGFQDGAYATYLAAVTSVDAQALRLVVDLSALDSSDEVWLLDPIEPRGFGPYTRGDHVAGGRFLATVEGDTAVVMGRALHGAAPPVALVGLSHFFVSLMPLKVLSCNINIACEPDAAIQQLSSGVAYLTRPSGFSLITGSGTLINAPGTAELEPYFLTASHVVGAETVPANIEIYWDFRATGCGVNDAPSLGSLPRSRGDALLATDTTLDLTLLELDSVPVGAYGRAYLGWDTRDPVIDEHVIGIHHPDNTHMRISYGRVWSINQEVEATVPAGGTRIFTNLTRVGWDDGVTELGSSGSCLLFDDNTLRIAGALTTGSTHACFAGPEHNYDYYSSFRTFFTQISPAYLSGSDGDPAYEDAVEPSSGCFGGAMRPPGAGGPPLGGDGVMVALLVALLWWLGRAAGSRVAPPRPALGNAAGR